MALAERVVFSVPSVYYPHAGEFGDERLLPLEVWEWIVEPFRIEELRLYGDPPNQEREHVLCVLQGQPVTEQLLALMSVPEQPFPAGITAIVHTREEQKNIRACLEPLAGNVEQIIVCDMHSTDRTIEIAREMGAEVMLHPQISNFDQARNASAMLAIWSHILYVDADERVPVELLQALRAMAIEQPSAYDGWYLPFRHHFSGHWLRSLYPGYTAPRLLKNGRFHFNARLHGGAVVYGPTVQFPPDNPALAITHYSFDSISHYQSKQNRYTDGEAANMFRDGIPFDCRKMLLHMLQDLVGYYDNGHAAQDGPHGLIYSLLSANYRLLQHAKLFEMRANAGLLQPQELVVPQNTAEIANLLLEALHQRPKPQAPAIAVAATPESASVVWSGPILDPSGMGQESNNFLFALDAAGVSVRARPLPWNDDPGLLSEAEHERFAVLCRLPAAPGFVHIQQDFPSGWERHPQAGKTIVRTMFETDRLPWGWAQACNRMDAIWVPSEFNRQTFVDSGVDPQKIAVIPGCFDPAPYLASYSPTPLTEQFQQSGRFTFLSVFDWTLHKSWDVLLKAFLQGFEGREDVQLVLKVWSTNGYTSQQIITQAATFVQETLDRDLLADQRIRFVTEKLSRSDLLALYKACDAFVLPSRGEGWGRPYMEAMACGKPTIGTNWSGNTAFMTQTNSYLLDYTLTAVPETGWKEIPAYKGHRWAEPNGEHLIETMQQVVEAREEGMKKGAIAQEEVCSRFSRETVGKLMAAEIARLSEEEAHIGERMALSPIASDKVHSHKEAPAPTEAPRGKGKRGKGANVADAARSTAANEANGQAHTQAVSGRAVRVRWEGAFWSWHSLALVNREQCKLLAADPKVELSLVPVEPTHFGPDAEPGLAPLQERTFASLSGPAQMHVRHFFPPRLEVPNEGKLVLVQPWEYGFLPNRWIEPILKNVSLVVCYSHYVRDVYLASGIPEEKLQVVPLGVDTSIFRPDAPPYVFTDEPGAHRLAGFDTPPFVFLFVGGTLHRKGIDLLEAAYLKAFSAFDNVVLVIKDTGTQTVYRGATEGERFKTLAADESRPAVIYLDTDLSAHALAGLYAAAHCAVFPYRGEGFCLPALEARACGCPVIVPREGPTDDFVVEGIDWLVEASRQPFGNGKIGEWDCCGPTWMLETDVRDLARAMRQAYANREATRARGEAAAVRVRSGWTWQHSVTELQKCLTDLAAQPVVQPTAGMPAEAVVQEREGPTSNSPTPAEALQKKYGERERIGGEDGPRLKIVEGMEIRDRRSGALEKAEPRLVRKLPTLSLCMIVKNEERVLADCLSSAVPFFDEIVVIDTGSTDSTVEIAKAHGAKVGFFPWCNDFSAARNVSLEQATGDWVMWMDADDTLPAECGKALRPLIALAEDRVTGYLMQVHIPPAPGDNGFTIVDHVKLFRNRPSVRFEGRIHEQILESIYRSGGVIERTNLYVVHSGYDHSPEGQARKRTRDTTILALDEAERPDHPFPRFNYGMTYFHLKEYDLAITKLKECLERSKPQESTVRKVYAMLTGCYMEKRDLDQARNALDTGLALFPNDPELLFRAGNLYRELGDFAAAENFYLKLFHSRESGHIDSLDVTMTSYKAHHNLALIYQDMNKLAESEQHWRAAVQISPSFAPSWQGLGELFVRLRRFDDARAVLQKLEGLSAEHAQALRQKLALQQVTSVV